MADGKPIEPWLDGVEGDDAKKIIESDKPFIQVVAGPGSGKTFGLKRRVRRLVQRDGVQRSQIFVGTFTRAIRDELLAALEPANPQVTPNDRIHIETLHSAAFRMLRDNNAAHPGREFRFLLGHEQEAMLYDIRDAAPDVDFDGLKDAMHRVESYWSMAGPLEDERFRGAMVQWLTNHRAMHVNEVVWLALNAMERGTLPSGVYSSVVVDEYQDLTAAEQVLVERLCRVDGCLMVLGDDDQSIYQFRYNHPGGITEFPKNKDTAKLEAITIRENRRCGRTIVDMANRMMAAAGSTKPAMIEMRAEAGTVDLVHWRSSQEEVDGLARYIAIEQDTDFLVLVPRRQTGYELRDRLGHDAWTSFHEEVLRTPLVRERFTFAALLANQDDAVALRAWFGFRGDSPVFAPERNTEAARSLEASGIEGRALIEGVADGTVVPKGTGRDAVRTRAAVYLRLSAETAGLDLVATIDFLFDPALAAALDDQEKRRYAEDDLMLLRVAAAQIAKAQREPNLLSVVDALRYRISTGQPLLDEEPDARVRIMTLYGAKGLEADAIVVAGLADNVLPGRYANNQAKREEQRRLLYVAITRARKNLVISWPLSMPYAHAQRRKVRIDDDTVFTTPSGELMVGLSDCRFIPAGLGAINGQTWLAAKGL